MLPISNMNPTGLVIEARLVEVMEPTLSTIDRTESLLRYEMPIEDIRDILRNKIGLTEYQSFLAVQAARLQVKLRDHNFGPANDEPAVTVR